MPKQLQISIPKPCHENWDKMNPVAKGRFCNSCEKQVIDFSSMSDRQLAEFFKKPSTGSVCGRFTDDQLDRQIEIPKKRIPWLKYFFQIAIPAFMVSCRNGFQHTTGKVEATERTENIFNKDRSDCTTVGQVSSFDTQEVAIPEYKIVEPPEDYPADTYQGGLKVTMGDWEISNPSEVKSPVCKEDTAHITSQIEEEICRKAFEDADVADSVKWLPEVVVRYSGTNTTIGIIAVKASTIKPKILDSVVMKNSEIRQSKPVLQNIQFSIFPNPLHSGMDLHLKLENPDEGYYQFSIISLSGQIVQRKQLFIDKEAGVISIETKQVAAGTYVVMLINEKTGKKYSEKIIIQ